jgi:putative tricarboxylic transport membrane protein
MIDFLPILFLAIGAGFVSGLLPGIGSSALMIASLPLLFALPPEFCIVYYVVAVQASQFSGSVAAVNFGMLGELTSYPALRERNLIVRHNLQRRALQFTAIGSMIACVIPVLLLLPLMDIVRTSSFIMRTDFLFAVACSIMFVCMFLKTNHVIVNTILIVVGVIMSQIGYQGEGSAAREFLTFGQPFLYAGIPFIAVLTGLIAVPLLVRHTVWRYSIQDNITASVEQESNTKLPIFSILRGTLLGLIAGLVPVIGTQMSSYIAWFSERKLHPGLDSTKVLQRLCAAESANNSSAVAVIIPLLLLGIAIVPSEMILLSVIQTMSWMPDGEHLKIGQLEFYQYLTLSVICCAGISYTLCYSLVQFISAGIHKHIKTINLAALFVLLVAVIYSGSLVEARLFFVSCFLVLACLALFFAKTDFMPLVIGYFVGDTLVDSTKVLNFLYF